MTQVLSEELIDNVKRSIGVQNREFLLKLMEEMRPADAAPRTSSGQTQDRGGWRLSSTCRDIALSEDR